MHTIFNLARKDFVALYKTMGVSALIIFVVFTVASVNNPIFVLFTCLVFMNFLFVSLPAYEHKAGSNAFFFSLPVSRKHFVISKYVESLFFILFFLIIGVITNSIGIFIHAKNTFSLTTLIPVVLIPPILFSSIVLPLTFKLEIRKLSIFVPLIFMVFYAIIFALIAVLGSLFDFSRLPLYVFLIAAVLFLGIFLLSYRISLSIMAKKDL